MRIGAAMDQIAEAVDAVPSLTGRVYPYPPDNATPPVAFVPFPTVDVHTTYRRGSDELDMSVVVVIDRLSDRSDRDRVARYMDGDGPESVTEAIERYDYTAIDFAVVNTISTTDYPLGGVDYWAVVFEVTATGSGTS